jgi:hypothetical protein
MGLDPRLKEDIIQKLKEQGHKEAVDPNDWVKVKEDLLLIADWFVDYCSLMNLRCQFTSIIRPKIKGISKTDIHADKRAFDVSLIGWTDSDARDCALTAGRELQGLGAISAKDGRERVCVFEDGIHAGKGRHLHFQVRP